MTQNQFEEMLNDLITKVLNDDELNILTNRYGLGCAAMSIKKAEKELNISAGAIRKIEAGALAKIKSSSEFKPVEKELSKINVWDFAPNGPVGYALLAMQILR